ncbi:replicon protein A2 isoform X2 [Wolffia australiana]
MYGQMDGSSLFSGGGFMPSQATQVPDSGVSPAKVTLVGLVTSKVERVTDVSFTLDDGTGRIDINRWVNESSDANEMAKILNGMYVKVNGQLKGFHGKRHAVAFSIRPITDFNDITLHLIECIYVHLYNSGAKSGDTTDQRPISNPGSTYQSVGTGYQAPNSNQFSARSSGKGPDDVLNLVLEFFNDPANLKNEHGLHVDEVIRRLGLPPNKIKDAINYHVDVGHIYSTIDDYHFKSAMNG